MPTYHGMGLSSEIRESISLDEDDLSDVEDEVFIRDGKNGYRLADDIGAKRPLMAPRRKLQKPTLASRLRNRPPLKIICKPCLYGIGGAIILLGFVILVAIVVSVFPLPINKIKQWVTKTAATTKITILPCKKLSVADVWSTNIQKITSETSVRTVDIDKDGVEDVLFGFGIGDNYGILHPNISCPMFFGVSPPCSGGVVALNGSTGELIWTKYLASAVFSIFCSADVTDDTINDCVITTEEGELMVLNPTNGTIIWRYSNSFDDTEYSRNVYSANFVLDQNNDNVSDILAAHTMIKRTQESQYSESHVLLICGKTGADLQKLETPNKSQIYYTPQMLPQNSGGYMILFGTGRPDSSGSLNVISMKEFLAGNTTIRTIFKDDFKGILTPSLLIDITGDNQVDIIIALFNSTILAINGDSFAQIWNFSVPNSETLSVPTPGFFNSDNITDFMIKYQTGEGYPIYYYSQTYIIDGKTGKPIQPIPLIDTVGSEMGGLTLSMQHRGFDYFLYWMEDCLGYEGKKDLFKFIDDISPKDQTNVDMCRLRFNSSKVIKLFALNEFEQPPGIQLYNSENRTKFEYINVKTPLAEAEEYVIQHPDFKMVPSNTVTEEVIQIPNYSDINTPSLFKTVKYSNSAVTSPFRHKFNDQGLVKNFDKQEKNTEREKSNNIYNDQQKYDENLQNDYDYAQPDLNNYQPNINDPSDPLSGYGDDALSMFVPKSKQQFLSQDSDTENAKSPRDPRSKNTPKKDLSPNGYGIYDYRNVRAAQPRLFRDLTSSPDEILRDTYYTHRERQLRPSPRYRERDISAASVGAAAKVERTIEVERANERDQALNLWNLESEREMSDKAETGGEMRNEPGSSGGGGRKRRMDGDVVTGGEKDERINGGKITGIPKVAAVGTLVKPLEPMENSVDLIFFTYWTPAKQGPQILTEKDINCVQNKMTAALNSKENFLNYEKVKLEELFKKQCLAERGINLQQRSRYNSAGSSKELVNRPHNVPYYEQIAQFSFGQMTVYRIRIMCSCDPLKDGERCNSFLDPTLSNWNSYLDRKGDGIYVRM